MVLVFEANMKLFYVYPVIFKYSFSVEKILNFLNIN